MHIAFNAWFWDQPYVGSGQYLRRLVTALRKLAPKTEIQLTLVLPPNLTNPADVPPDVDVIETKGSRSNIGKVIFEQRTFPAAVSKLKADIAHVPYWGAPLSSPAKLITTVLDVIPLALPVYTPTLSAKIYTSLVTATARGSAHILTISHAAKADIIEHIGLPDEMITVTHLAADDSFHPRMGVERDAAVREKYNLPEQFVLYVGGFDVRKNVKQLLQAFTYVSKAEGDNTILVIAGREPQWGEPMFPDIRAYAEELGLTPYIQWIGTFEESEKASLYRLASMYVFPSLYEGFGLMTLEAMATGTPVIANNIPVISEITDQAAYLVKEGDAREMGGAILSLLLENSLRETQISRGLGRATNFSWRKTAKETLTVYENVLRL